MILGDYHSHGSVLDSTSVADDLGPLVSVPRRVLTEAHSGMNSRGTFPRSWVMFLL